MEKFNGNGLHFCKNCGGTAGIHRADDWACPNRGEDQTGLKPAIFLNTKFEPQDWGEFDSPSDIQSEGIKEILRNKKDGLSYPSGIGKKYGTRTLFDDYFLAVLQGVSTAAAASAPGGSIYDEVPEILVSFSFDVAKAALKKREEYLIGEVSK